MGLDILWQLAVAAVALVLAFFGTRQLGRQEEREKQARRDAYAEQQKRAEQEAAIQEKQDVRNDVTTGGDARDRLRNDWVRDDGKGPGGT